jgi:hypothetical protein
MLHVLTRNRAARYRYGVWLVAVLALQLLACGRLDFDDGYDAPRSQQLSCSAMTMPWPMVHGCATNAGHTTFAGPAASATVTPIPGTLHGGRSVVIGAGNRVYVEAVSEGTDPAEIDAFDASSGSNVWQSTYLIGFGELGMAISDQGVLFATTNYGKLAGFDVTTGSNVVDVQYDGVVSAPVLDGSGAVYVGTNSYGFFATDTSGVYRWSTLRGSADTSTAPAIGNGRVYTIEHTSVEVVALDVGSGATLFAIPIGSPPVGSPVLDAGAIYVATQTHGIVAFDPASGGQLWQFLGDGTPIEQPALLSNGDLVTTTAGGSIYMVSARVGTELKRTTLPSAAVALGPPVVDGADIAYIPTDAGIVAYDSKTNTIITTYSAIGTPAIGDGYLAVAPTHGTSTLLLVR